MIDIAIIDVTNRCHNNIENLKRIDVKTWEGESGSPMLDN